MEKAQKWARLLLEQERCGILQRTGGGRGELPILAESAGKEEVSSFVRITKETAPIEILVSEKIRVLIPAATSAEDIRKFLETANALNS